MKEKSQVIEAIKKTSPSVVSIVITKDLTLQNNLLLTPFGAPFFIVPDSKPIHKKVRVGGGSGFFVSNNGLIMTNKHVIADESAEYTVITPDGKKHSTKVLARDPINDVAFIKIDTGNVPTCSLGDSSCLELGQTAIAIGNALGEFQNTVSLGVISGLSRYITAQSGMAGRAQQLRGLIQTDAAINPGNSGGPLIDIEGNVIGINVAIVAGAQNISFAIPINSAKKALADLNEFGKIRYPLLGVRYLIINADVKDRYKLPVDYGAWVVRELAPGDFGVVPGSAAERAGLQEKDIILEFDNKKITEEVTLEDIIKECRIGQEVEMKVLRGQEEKKLKAKLEERK